MWATFRQLAGETAWRTTRAEDQWLYCRSQMRLLRLHHGGWQRAEIDTKATLAKRVSIILINGRVPLLRRAAAKVGRQTFGL